MPLPRRPRPGQKPYVAIAWEVKMLILVALALGMLFAKELGFVHRALKIERDEGRRMESERDGLRSGRFERRQVTSTLTSSSTSTPTPGPTGSTTVFQVDPPLLGPQGLVLNDGLLNASGIATTQSVSSTSCSVTLMEFVFANSFGKPFVGNYTPPSCASTSNTVLMNLTVTSQGEQFDRLAHMYLGDIEVFRTSTAEPTRNGIVWTVMTDMSHLLSLWRSPQTVIFDLGNQVTTNLTGSYSTLLTASFFSASQAVDPANVIFPISAKMGAVGMGSVFSLPDQNATTTIDAFPRNVKRAIVSLSATGQGDEEFWWSNALQSDVAAFNNTPGGGMLFGYSPFREVQLFIDGTLAGVVWPFPIIFTGGVVPGLWSPVVGIEAFDLAEGTLDVSPWLGVLCDGNSHTFSVNVVGLDDDGGTNAVLSGRVGSSWVVSGKVFIWLDDDATSITTGTPMSISTPDPAISVSQILGQNSTGGNETLAYTTNVKRELTISSTITTQSGSLLSTWTQSLTHTDDGLFFSQGVGQTNNIQTQGRDSFLLGMATPYQYGYSFPLFANSTITPIVTSNGTSAGILITADVSRNKSLTLNGNGIFATGLQAFANLPLTEGLAMMLQGISYFVSQNGSAGLTESSQGNRGIPGESNVLLRVGGRSPQGTLGMEEDVELWWRSVVVGNGSVVSDDSRLAGHAVGDFEGVVVDVADGGVEGVEGPGLGRMPLLRGMGESEDG